MGKGGRWTQWWFYFLEARAFLQPLYGLVEEDGEPCITFALPSTLGALFTGWYLKVALCIFDLSDELVRRELLLRCLREFCAFCKSHSLWIFPELPPCYP